MKKNKQENDLRPKIGICKKFHENRKNFNFEPGFEPATFGALQYNVLAPYRGDQFWPSAFEKFLIFPRRAHTIVSLAASAINLMKPLPHIFGLAFP